MNEQKFEDSSELNKITDLREAYDEFIKKNDYENALPTIKKIVEIEQRIDDWIAYATCQIYLGNIYDAMRSFSAIVNTDNRNVDAWINLGRLYYKVGIYDIALTCFDYVAEELDVEPGSLKALDLLVNMATVLDNLHRYRESKALFNHIYKAKPDFACIWLDRGLSLCKQKRYEEALFLFDQALLIEPSNEDILINKGLILTDLKRSEEALLSFDKSLEINNKNSRTWLFKGNLFSELELYNDALYAFNKSIELGDRSYSLLINYAVILLALENWKKGTEALSIAIESLSSANDLMKS